ncbi:Importin subunit alpha-2 [Tetrabaena socialis]|uniref:Importin subunit alpha-2 n=1 Tax=Tetrabaena socialis TaxID=47790 RepID=A0A2J7ZHJ0_9CHLO|nr:Importin subunit alpha-2 [Tetrabaena socialis]|eukprot:PNG99730.1 Importin subunit alpha-2 [Tetrabaena socialis]
MDGATPATEGGAVEVGAAESPAVRCCGTALWALGMMVRGRIQETAQLAHQPALLAGLRRLLVAPRPHLPLLREAAWLLAFIGASGGAEATAALVEGGGVVPGLLLSMMRCVRQAAALRGDDPATLEAARPLHQALLALLPALTNIAAEPAHALPLLAELQAMRPLPPLPLPPAAGTAAAAAAAAAAGGSEAGVAASGVQAWLACLEGRVSHRGVVRGAAALAAGLAAGACRAGDVAVDALRSTLREAGVVGALVALLKGSALDIRKEAAAALTLLCTGATGGDGGGAAGPGSLDMLRVLGVARGADAQGVLGCMLALLRSPDADAVHCGLRFVALVLGGLRRGAVLVESLDGIDALEAVQYGTGGCRVPELQAWAGELVDAHYGEDYGEGEEQEGEEGEDEGM